MRRHDGVLGIGHRRDFLHLKNAARVDDVGLNYIGRSMLENLPVFVVREAALARRHRNVDLRPHVSEAGYVFRRNRFFKPTRVKLLKAAP